MGEEISSLTQRLRELEGDSRVQTNREQYLALEKRALKLQKERDSLHSELEIARMDPKEAHSRFIAKVPCDVDPSDHLRAVVLTGEGLVCQVKADNQRIAELEAQAKMYNEDIGSVRILPAY